MLRLSYDLISGIQRKRRDRSALVQLLPTSATYCFTSALVSR